MGTYLSTPVTEKKSEEGEIHGMTFGASAMQGWRRSMEDEHIAMALQVPDDADGLRSKAKAKDDAPPTVAMFAVFDGHGGKEVARYCEKHMPEELMNLDEYKSGDVGDALIKVFHRIDEMLWDPSCLDELESYKKDESKKANTEGKDADRAEDGEDGDGPSGLSRDNRSDSLSTREVMELFRHMLAINEGAGAGAGAGADEADEGPAMGARAPGSAAGDLAGQDEASAAEKTSDESEGAVQGRRVVPAPPVAQARPGVCTLPPVSVTAGCTSVVGLVVGNTIHVANAGDSRAVMCRNGEAYPLSEDHKPMDARELARIEAVGGFVNQAGRVNGNLNLSRSIGDLKYKQSDAPPSAQMITAEPDIVSVEMKEGDQFIILACDGIWDCMSNQEACDFVLEKLASGMTPVQVAEACMDACLSEDPKKTTGIGGDNMTCVIATLPGVTFEGQKL